MNDRSIEKIDVLKIDVDGPDLMVLKGAGGFLSGQYPPAIVVEFSYHSQDWGYVFDDVHKFLGQFGYEINANHRHSLSAKLIKSIEDFDFDVSPGKPALNLFCLIPRVHRPLMNELWFVDEAS